MRIEDIHHDLEVGDTAGIRDAFRALVGWPGEDEVIGAETENLPMLLHRVCVALAGDMGIMPGDTMQTIQDVNADLAGGTYADGAAAVLERPDWWRARFGQEG